MNTNIFFSQKAKIKIKPTKKNSHDKKVIICKAKNVETE